MNICTSILFHSIDYNLLWLQWTFGLRLATGFKVSWTYPCESSWESEPIQSSVVNIQWSTLVIILHTQPHLQLKVFEILEYGTSLAGTMTMIIRNWHFISNCCLCLPLNITWAKEENQLRLIWIRSWLCNSWCYPLWPGCVGYDGGIIKKNWLKVLFSQISYIGYP